MFTAGSQQKSTAKTGIYFKGVNVMGDILHTDLTPLDMQHWAKPESKVAADGTELPQACWMRNSSVQ